MLKNAPLQSLKSYLIFTDELFALKFDSFINLDTRVTGSDLLQGSECDLLIDTGVGIHSLPRYLSWAGLRPASSDQETGPDKARVRGHTHRPLGQTHRQWSVSPGANTPGDIIIIGVI